MPFEHVEHDRTAVAWNRDIWTRTDVTQSVGVRCFGAIQSVLFFWTRATLAARLVSRTTDDIAANDKEEEGQDFYP